MTKVSTRAIALLLTVASGCTKVSQVQYFEVTGDPDPETGISRKAFYRMRINGQGMAVSQYHLKAAYVSAATLDTLNGKIPTIPEADLSEDNEKAFVAIRGEYLDSLKQYSQTIRNQSTTVTPEQQESNLVQMARQAWYSTLSDTDLLSLGQEQDTNPFRFRKLIFYTSATSVSLEDYDKQVSSSLEKATTLARHFKKRAATRQSKADDELKLPPSNVASPAREPTKNANLNNVKPSTTTRSSGSPPVESTTQPTSSGSAEPATRSTRPTAGTSPNLP